MADVARTNDKGKPRASGQFIDVWQWEPSFHARPLGTCFLAARRLAGRRRVADRPLKGSRLATPIFTSPAARRFDRVRTVRLDGARPNRLVGTRKDDGAIDDGAALVGHLSGRRRAPAAAKAGQEDQQQRPARPAILSGNITLTCFASSSVFARREGLAAGPRAQHHQIRGLIVSLICRTEPSTEKEIAPPGDANSRSRQRGRLGYWACGVERRRCRRCGQNKDRRALRTTAVGIGRLGGTWPPVTDPVQVAIGEIAAPFTDEDRVARAVGHVGSSVWRRCGKTCPDGQCCARDRSGYRQSPDRG